jgi:hypothetical protein
MTVLAPPAPPAPTTTGNCPNHPDRAATCKLIFTEVTNGGRLPFGQSNVRRCDTFVCNECAQDLQLGMTSTGLDAEMTRHTWYLQAIEPVWVGF